MKPIKIIKSYLNETNSEVWRGKYLSDTFPIKTERGKKMLCHHCLSALL
jgi:hypothetical protein